MESRIQHYLRTEASRARTTERVGPFVATFTEHSDNPYLNYALPDDGAQPSMEEVAALIRAFEARNRRPRLEYIAALAPEVEPALLAAGFVVEGRLPLMTCVPSQGGPLPPPPGIELLVPQTDQELLDMVAAQNEAYGDQPPGPDVVPRLRASSAAGQINLLARDSTSGEPAGGGICTVSHDGLTEVGAIGVREPYRRRGIAAAMTARLLDEAQQAGVTLAFLMAEGEPEARIYARAGFTLIGDILHISRPLG